MPTTTTTYSFTKPTVGGDATTWGAALNDNWDDLDDLLDGTSTLTALAVSSITGSALQASATDTTAGKLARADYVYGPGNLVGTVSETSGTPTGAVIESGSNANGDYVKFADGTMICSIAVIAGSSGGAATWTYPESFVGAPTITGMARSGAARFTVLDSVNANSATFSVYSTAGTRTTQNTSLTAIGKWFT